MWRPGQPRAQLGTWKGRAGEQATSTRLEGRLPEEGLSQASVVALRGEAVARPRWDMSLICLLYAALCMVQTATPCAQGDALDPASRTAFLMGKQLGSQSSCV